MATFDNDLLSEEHLDNIEIATKEMTISMNVVRTMKRWRKWSPCHRKMLLFALYPNQYMKTTKIKIRWDTDRLNSIYGSKKFNSTPLFFAIWIENVNPLSAKLTKWPNTLKQFVGNLPTNCLSVFGHFVGLALKRLMRLLRRI